MFVLRAFLVVNSFMQVLLLTCVCVVVFAARDIAMFIPSGYITSPAQLILVSWLSLAAWQLITASVIYGVGDIIPHRENMFEIIVSVMYCATGLFLIGGLGGAYGAGSSFVVILFTLTVATAYVARIILDTVILLKRQQPEQFTPTPNVTIAPINPDNEVRLS